MTHMKKHVAIETVADAYLEVLSARGIKYFFGNGGSDFGPIAEAFAKRLSTEAPGPTPMVVPHEITAMGMAHGYTMVTGQPQVVMVHTIAGTANAIGGLINAIRTGVPMLFSAGRTPLTEGSMKGSRGGLIHWAQESFDQGSMVREWVKWDYELRHGADVEGVVDRALAIATTDPQGPVYLTLPNEVLAEDQEALDYDDEPRMPASEAAASDRLIQRAAAALARAKNPILITRGAGKDAEAVAPLVRLCTLLNMPVFEGSTPSHMNFPKTHPLLQPGGIATPHLDQADVVVVVENDVPWTPKAKQPSPDATIIAIGADPLYSRYPVRGFRMTLGLAGNVAQTLTALASAVAAQDLDAGAIQARGAEWAANHQKLRAAITARALEGRDAVPLDKAWVSYCLEQLRDDDTILVNELGLESSQFQMTQPGTLFDVSPAGVLGWALGAALGAKLAAPEKTVIACVGDGSYIYGVPPAVHWVARRYELPVLFIVWNNSGWNAVSGTTRSMYPQGWAVKSNTFPFSDLSPSVDFVKEVEACGGYGERVETPQQLPSALERALRMVKVEKRQALLEIIGGSRS